MFYRNKPVVLNLYTSDPAIFKYSKWEKANKHKPSWWKSLQSVSSRSGETANMKHCTGFNDLYSNAITIPMWCDFRASIGKAGIDHAVFEFASPKAGAETHPEEQRGDFLPDTNYQHTKLLSPWIGVCKESVQFMMTNAFWDNTKPFDYFVPNGVIDFRYQAGSHVNLFVRKEETFTELFIPQGEPLALLVPLTERKVVLKYNLVTEEEFRRMYQEKEATLWFTQKYSKAKKCPFH